MSESHGSASDTAFFAFSAADAPSLFGGDAEVFRILAITPLERPDLRLAQAVRRQQAAAAIDIGRDPATWPALFERLLREPAGFGLRLPEGVAGLPPQPPAGAGFLIASGALAELPAGWRALPVIAQVCSLPEAERALAAGACGLIAKGQESGGRAGDDSSFMLLQRMLGLTERLPVKVPVWCQGGMGLYTAAGAIAGGAFGVVIDSVLAGYPECGLPSELKTRIAALDGSEVRTIAGHNVYTSARDASGLDDLDAGGVARRLAEGEAGAEPMLYVLGQDAALSQAALAECANVEALVNTLRQRISAQLRQARALKVLDENNAWAVSHGTRYPVAQGPMTRVSDTADFAAAVADAGGLPFLALSLMPAAPSRKLLEETRAKAGDRPWGVGVLGFAPADILEPQLELVREFRPSALLLAGGRPSQARPFVEMGIPTYLHVPSPGLIDLFLKDGATHFVFEGRECGGHVGPRYSFVLWEQAMARLMRARNPERLHVLFAGGIHDARSSAMVAAIAAPLAARGAKIGVLMGTAYIATEEAVTCGAVLPRFQQKALASDSTTLVETAPGHAIRCVPSGFVDLFEREKGRLRREGVEQRKAWLELEKLTVGRLRVASKGVDRVDGVMGSVTAERQDAEGMYMIGQAIALKNAVTTVAELHRQVSRGAVDYLDRIDVPGLSRAAQAEPVAIVGMACIYPGSPDLESFWTNILEGGDFIREVPEERWSAAAYWQPGMMNPGKTPSKWGGFVADVPFDPVEYGIPPQSIPAIEPAQLLSLETARKALADAGYADRWFDREKTAVIFGAEGGMDLSQQYTFGNLYPHFMGADMPAALAQSMPVLTEDSFAGVLGNVIAGRIANRLGLGGVNYAVDSACASSLTAIELGVKELRGGSSDMVLAGGADFHNGIADFLMFASVGALSPTGRSRPFDNHADGIALGEGVGVLVMKRLSDAERDGDRVYAVIDAVSGSSDGKALGLTAPRREGQRRALDRAYWQAGVLPSDIGLMEAHGTGTVVGDRTELETLTDVFTAGGSVPGQTQLGSVKSQIGHTKCAAGIAGVIKVAKALHHRVLPATQQITAPNAAFRPDSPFRLNRKASPWMPSGGSKPRGAVSAFGFGGTNFHAVLSAYETGSPAIGAVEFPAELFAFRGAALADAEAALRRLQTYVAQSDAPLSMRDLALGAWAAQDGPVQIAFVARGRADLLETIAKALAGSDEAGIRRRAATAGEAKVAALFGGQGGQYPHMLSDIFVYFSGWMQDLLAAGKDVLPALYPATAYDDATRIGQDRTLADTRNAQPALGLVEFAAFRLFERLGMRADMAAGHSYGELVALATAGAFGFGDLMRLSHARAEAMTASMTGDTGLMAAVRLDAGALQPLLADFPNVVIANRNSPIQSVIAGPTADVKAACAFLATQSVGAKILDTDRAFHSPLMANSSRRFAAALAGQTVAVPQWPVYSNVSAGLHGTPEQIKTSLADHLVSPVRFTEEVERMYADGARVFVEFGPRKVLGGLVDKILKDRPHAVVTVDPGDRGLAGLLDAAAQLAVLLPGFDAAPLFEGRAARLDLDRPQTLSATTWLVNGGASRRLSDVPAPLRQTPVVVAAAPAMAPAAGDEALVTYLSNMREVVRAQRDVLLGYFGSPVERMPDVSTSPAKAIELKAVAVTPALTSAAPPATAVDFEALLLQIIGERTGYPADKLDADLDLEADLSIDSIKRLEIIGDLAERLNLRERLGGQSDGMLEQLASLKTLRAMLAVLTENLPAGEESPAAAPALGVSTLLPEIVSQCTGYPLEALDPDLDLEADLSIDSIKRIEIIGQLMGRLGIEESGNRDAMLEQLSALKTLRAMIDWMEGQVGGATAPAPIVSPAPAQAEGPAWPLRRYVLRERDAGPAVPGAVKLSGRRFLITDDGLGVAQHVAAALVARGALARIVDFRDLESGSFEPGRVDGLLHLWSLNPASGIDDVKRFFAVARDSLLGGAVHLLVAEAVSRPGRGGFAGMVKTLSKEFPALRAHWLDLDTSEKADVMAAYVERELLADEPPTEVRYAAGKRLTPDVVPAELDLALDGRLLDKDSVVLLTGGARGITAGLAIALARRYHCRLELAGRSELPSAPEGEATRGIADPKRLRQVLLAAEPGLRPADVESRVRRILAEREIARTLEQVRLAGSDVRYTQIDVRDEARFAEFVADIYARHGRIDGVIHGAGVVEDKLVRDKTPESFGRVFDTKVAPAMMLRTLIRDDVKLVVFFSSVASAFGNRGQVDYASANDVLDKVARDWQSRIKGRVLSVNWGPWADTGMVSDSLRADYERRGVGLIPQREGIDALLRELSAPAGEPQVVLMCGNLEVFQARPTPAVQAA